MNKAFTVFAPPQYILLIEKKQASQEILRSYGITSR